MQQQNHEWKVVETRGEKVNVCEHDLLDCSHIFTVTAKSVLTAELLRTAAKWVQ